LNCIEIPNLIQTFGAVTDTARGLDILVGEEFGIVDFV
jgi:hypothetical protein